MESLGSRINLNNHEKGKHKAPSNDFESNHHGRIEQPSLNVKLPLESPSSSSKFSISPSRGENLEDRLTKRIDGSEPKIGVVENHKLRNTSPNHTLSFGPNRLSRRSNSLDLSSEAVHSKAELEKDVDCFGSEIPKLRNPAPTHRFSIDLNRFSRRSSHVSSEHDPHISESQKDVGFNLGTVVF